MTLTGVADWREREGVGAHERIAPTPRHPGQEGLHEVERSRDRELPVQPLQ